MKKKYIIIFLIIMSVNLTCRFIMTPDISTLRAVIMTVFLIILPFIYAYGSFYFTRLSWKTVGIVSAAVIVSGGIMVLFADNKLPLSEFGWIYMQLPSLIFSFIAAYFTFSAKTRHKKIQNFASFLTADIAAAVCFFGFCSLLVSWSNSSM